MSDSRFDSESSASLACQSVTSISEPAAPVHAAVKGTCKQDRDPRTSRRLECGLELVERAWRIWLRKWRGCVRREPRLARHGPRTCVGT